MAIEPLGDSHRSMFEQAFAQGGADVLAEAMSMRGRLVFNKVGFFSDRMIADIFDVLQEKSLRGEHRTYRGVPLRFFVYNLDAEDFSNLDHRERVGKYVQTLAGFTSRVSEYQARAMAEIEDARKQFPGALDIAQGAGDAAIMEYLLKAKLQYKSTYRFPIQLREALKRFGNPRQYSVDMGRVEIEEDDDSYPTLMPVINIQFGDLPDGDPMEVLDDYNARLAPVKKDYYEGKIKLEDIFSPEEIMFANKCRGIVDTVDGLAYNSFDLAPSHYIVAAPLFPYDVIRRRCGYHYEEWLGFGPNDELFEHFEGMHPEMI